MDLKNNPQNKNLPKKVKPKTPTLAISEALPLVSTEAKPTQKPKSETSLLRSTETLGAMRQIPAVLPHFHQFAQDATLASERSVNWAK